MSFSDYVSIGSLIISILSFGTSYVVFKRDVGRIKVLFVVKSGGAFEGRAFVIRLNVVNIGRRPVIIENVFYYKKSNQPKKFYEFNKFDVLSQGIAIDDMSGKSPLENIKIDEGQRVVFDMFTGQKNYDNVKYALITLTTGQKKKVKMKKSYLNTLVDYTNLQKNNASVKLQASNTPPQPPQPPTNSHP